RIHAVTSRPAPASSAGANTPAPPARRGRPRDAAADDAILHATVDMLAEVGFDRLTIEAIAARAQIGKPSIYRRWHSKAELVVDAVTALIPFTPASPDQPDGDVPELIL